MRNGVKVLYSGDLIELKLSGDIKRPSWIKRALTDPAFYYMQALTFTILYLLD